MSHFSVLVIGPDPAAQLQPFHEFECTGTNDEHVQDVDITDEVRSEYESGELTIYEIDGERVLDEDTLYRDPTPDEIEQHGLRNAIGSSYGGGVHYRSADWGDGRGYRAKMWDPEHLGAVARSVPYSEAMSLAEFVEYSRGEQEIVRDGEAPNLDGSAKFGYVVVDEGDEVVKIIKRTNPNAEWDWWGVGGRWCGFFPIKDGHDALAVGEGAGAARGLKAGPRTGDQVRKRAVDFDRARDDVGAEASRAFDVWEKCFLTHGRPRSWPEIRKANEGDIDRARDLYRGQPCIAAWLKTDDAHPITDPVEKYGFDRQAYIQKQRNQALVPFAVLKDGKWHQRGSMGWWGIVHDEQDRDVWAEQVQRLYDELPDDTILTLVDCHI